MKLNEFEWEEYDELPKKEKIKKKPKKVNPSDEKEKDTYKKKRKRGNDLDVLF